MKRATFDDFALGVPDGWVNASTILLVEPPDGEFARNLTVTRDFVESPTAIEVFASGQGKLLEDGLRAQGYRVREEGKITIDGITAYQRIHSFRVEGNGPEVTQLLVSVPAGRSVLTFTATDLSTRFDQSRSLFLQVIRGVQLGGAGRALTP